MTAFASGWMRVRARARQRGVELPLIELPVRPGRSLAMVVEIAARNWRLKAEGYDAVAELDRRLKKHYTHQE